MATQKNLYGAVTAFTLTGTSLGSYAAREGTIVDNSVNLYIDMEITGKVTVGAAAALGDCYLLLSASDGTNKTYPATGADAAITIPSIDLLGTLRPGDKVPGTELIFCCAIKTRGVAAATAVPFSAGFVAQLFGGNIPIGGIAPVLVNCQGQAFDATAGHTVLNYTGLQYQIA